MVTLPMLESTIQPGGPGLTRPPGCLLTCPPSFRHNVGISCLFTRGVHTSGKFCLPSLRHCGFSLLSCSYTSGRSSSVHINDCLMSDPSPWLLHDQIRFTLQCLQQLGWEINFEKSELIPFQILHFIGGLFMSRSSPHSADTLEPVPTFGPGRAVVGNPDSQLAILARLAHISAVFDPAWVPAVTSSADFFFYHGSIGTHQIRSYISQPRFNLTSLGWPSSRTSTISL